MILGPTVAASLLGLGLTRALTYHVARERGDPSCIVLVGLLISFCLGVVAAALGVVFIPHWLHGYSERVVTFAQWSLLITPMILVMWSIDSVLQGLAEFTWYNQNQYLPPLLALISLVGLAIYGALSPFTVALAMFGSWLAIVVLNLIRIVPICTSGIWEPIGSIRRLLSYGLRAYGLEVAHRITSEADRIVLIGLISPAALGIYVVAKSTAQPASKLSLAVAAVLFPEASRREAKQGARLLGRAAWISTAITGAAAAGLAVVAPPLIELLYGQAFVAAVTPFRILVVDAVIVSFVWILAHAFLSAGRPGVAAAELSIGLVVSVLGMLLLVPAWGATGAALAVLVSSIVRLAVVLLCFPVVLKERLLSLLPQRQDLVGLFARHRDVG